MVAEAARNFVTNHDAAQWERFQRFCATNAYWLNDYALYNLVRQDFQLASWHSWPKEFGRRDPSALSSFARDHAHELECEKAIQFAFDEQWSALRSYCGERSIPLRRRCGDFCQLRQRRCVDPPELFDLDKDLNPIHVAGVHRGLFQRHRPKMGQSPSTNGTCSPARASPGGWTIRRARALYDSVRLDHFRGFEAFWQIPAEDRTAVGGQWIKAPGAQLFAKLREQLGETPFLAEDLGLVTPEVGSTSGRSFICRECGSCNSASAAAARTSTCRIAMSATPSFIPARTTMTRPLGWWQHETTEVERAAVPCSCQAGGKRCGVVDDPCGGGLGRRSLPFFRAGCLVATVPRRV